MNGFVSHQLEIGSNQPVHKYKECAKCNERRPPEGGIQMNHTKWYCASCWTNRVTGRNLKTVRSSGGKSLEKAK